MASVKQEMKYIRARKREIMRRLDEECERLLRSGGIDRENKACTKIVLSVALHNLSLDLKPMHPDNRKEWNNLSNF